MTPRKTSRAQPAVEPDIEELSEAAADDEPVLEEEELEGDDLEEEEGFDEGFEDDNLATTAGEVSDPVVEPDAETDLSLEAIAEADDPDDEDEEEDAAAVLVRVVHEDDEDDGDVDGLREGEFICTSCFLAKGPTQLADQRRQLCRDCV